MQAQVKNIPVRANGESLQFDAKQFLKKTYKHGPTYATQFSKFFPNLNISASGRNPIWVPIEEMSSMVERLHKSEKIAEFDMQQTVDSIKDWAFSIGLTSYKSAARLKEEEKKEAAITEQKQVGVNPVIRFLNDAWFPVLASTVFAIVIGSFSYEIFSDTIGMPPVLNFLLATIYVLFPVLTSIRQYQFDIDGFKLSPLALVMVFDMIFTAYHVGWLREEGYTPETEMHPVLKIAFIIIIPVMQKATNDMILKIRTSYQRKGWLPSVI